MTMRSLLIGTAACAAIATAAVPAHAQTRVRRVERPEQNQQTQPKAFEWSGELASGQRLILRSLNGPVSVERASGRTLEVVANKKWRRGDPATVKIDATRVNGGDVLLCARWTANTVCEANRYSMSSEGGWSRNNDTEVEFNIKLPAGTRASLNTTNGSIEVIGTASVIEAFTTNGEIVIESSDGATRAHTTNGDIDVRMTKLPAGGASYHTTNGSITVTLPEGTDANLDARTTLGRVQSDFPITVSGSMSPRRIVGTIGKGGPTLEVATTLGSVRVQKK